MSRNTLTKKTETTMEIKMNSRQHINTFDTRIFWAMPLEKPTRGKPIQERFFY
jgi:hypothetical protein